jgi:hypothetical protein
MHGPYNIKNDDVGFQRAKEPGKKATVIII